MIVSTLVQFNVREKRGKPSLTCICPWYIVLGESLEKDWSFLVEADGAGQTGCWSSPWQSSAGSCPSPGGAEALRTQADTAQITGAGCNSQGLPRNSPFLCNSFSLSACLVHFFQRHGPSPEITAAPPSLSYSLLNARLLTAGSVT